MAVFSSDAEHVALVKFLRNIYKCKIFIFILSSSLLYVAMITLNLILIFIKLFPEIAADGRCMNTKDINTIRNMFLQYPLNNFLNSIKYNSTKVKHQQLLIDYNNQYVAGLQNSVSVNVLCNKIHFFNNIFFCN